MDYIHLNLVSFNSTHSVMGLTAARQHSVPTGCRIVEQNGLMTYLDLLEHYFKMWTLDPPLYR